GIRVNSVHPGVIETPMIMQEDVKEQVDAFAKTIPMKRIAKVEEVSQALLFLASDDSSYSTGSEFVIDGGFTAHSNNLLYSVYLKLDRRFFIIKIIYLCYTHLCNIIFNLSYRK